MVDGKCKFVVACGGTGGHSFPGLAVAKELLSRGHEVTVWMSGRSVESSVLKGWEGEVFATGAKQLSLRGMFANLRAFFKCRKELKRNPPEALLAMGSYSSVAPVLAAAVCGVPVVLHEANTVPGRAVDFLSDFARKVAISFPKTAEYFSESKIVHTGLPVRMEVAGCEPFADVSAKDFKIFITGGSQGAHMVNEIVVRAMQILKNDLVKRGRGLFVIHQTGVKDEAFVAKAYADAGVTAQVKAFEHEMGRAFATADVVIARAGASTCFELALTGKPAFFIPLPSAMRNHQHYNASAFASVGAGAEGVQAELKPRALANWLLKKAENPVSLANMATKMKSLARPDAAARVADLVESVAAEERADG